MELDICREISSRYGLPLQFIMKEFRLMDILSQIQTINSEINLNIILKGGTAINKAYFGNVSRFSEDIDFDEISNAGINERIERIKLLVKKIKGYEIDKGKLESFPISTCFQSAEKLQALDGNNVDKMRTLHKTFRFDCFFRNELNQKDNIRLEFSLRQTELFTVNKPISHVLKSEVTSGLVSGMLVYSMEDLFARKLHALYDREEGKDLYDAGLCFDKINDKKILIKAIEAMLESEGLKINSKQFLSKTRDKLQKADLEKMKRLTNNYIPISVRPNWSLLKDKVINELTSLEDLNK